MSERTHTPFDQPDPGAVARTERFIDALAKRQPVEFSDVADQRDSGERALAGLLGDWRDELRVPARGGLCPEREALGALNRGLAARRRTRRNMALVGTVAATMLGIGGFVAMMGEAQPGDTLYGVHTKVFGEPASVHDERIALSAQTDLDLVEQMIALGQWDEAQDKLASVSDRVQTVKDSDRKQDLIERVNLLNAKVANRDPNATVVPSSLPSAAPAVSMTNQQPNSVGG
jgi:Anti-sigma-D factor RsdA to sigma factor binding region